MAKRLYDLIIVGAGPAGLSAGIFANEMRLKTLLLEAEQPGGQLVNLYPFKIVSDYPGFPPAPAAELAAKVFDHAQKMGCRILTWRKVTKIIKKKNYFLLLSTKGEYHARAVILSVGLGVFSPRKPAVPGEEKFAHKGVFHQPQDPKNFISQKILVVGGGDSAFETATHLADHNHVTLIHRSNTFRAMEAVVQEARQKGVKILLNHELKAVMGDKQVRKVKIINNQTGEEKELTVDQVFILIGYVLEPELLSRWGLEIENHALKVDHFMQTSQPGIFACGELLRTGMRKNEKSIGQSKRKLTRRLPNCTMPTRNTI